MNWMDMVVVAIFIIAGLEGYAKGFIRSFISTTSWVISAICAIKFYPMVSYYFVSNTPIYSKINEVINDKVTVVSNINMGEASFDISSIMKLPEVVDKLLISPELSTESIVGNSLSEVISKLLLDIISIVLIILAVKIILLVLSTILDNFAKLPVLKQMNRFSGLLFGFAKGGIIIFIILAVCVPIISLIENDFIFNSLQNSTMTKYLYDHNLLLLLFKQATDGLLHF